jgi:adenylate cyclase
MRRSGLLPFGIAVLLSFFFAGMRLWAPYHLELPELRSIDFRLQARGRVPVGEEVAIVAIDEKSLKEIGRWPWSRTRVATLIAQLTRLGAAMIALDMVFAEPEPDHDQELADAIRHSGKVVLGYFLDFDLTPNTQHPTPDMQADGVFASAYNLVRPGRGESPGEKWLPTAPHVVASIPLISSAARRAGFFNFIPDVDGIYRRVPLAIRYQDKILPPLSLEALRVYLGNVLLGITFQEYGVAGITLARTSLPTDEAGEMWINYAGPARSFPYYSAADVLNGKVAATALQGKIALVGTTATGTFDARATPFDPVFPGVEIHATVIDNILHGRFVIRPKWLVLGDIGVLLWLGLVLGAALQRAKGVWGGVLSGGVAGAYVWGSQLFFVHSGVPLSVVYPVLLIFSLYLSVTLVHYVKEEREKRRIRAAFSLYLHPEVARMVSENPALLRLGGEKKELTVIFTDIRGFTSISEMLDPEALVEFLNEYLGAMTDIVFAHGGLLDKYIGDAIMALWGTPLPAPDHAASACRAALDMTARLQDLRQEWKTRGLPPLEIGVGINTGPMVVGNMGSSRRFNYTVMGDQVNLGSRLEGLNKFYGTRILLSESTRAQLGEEFLMREVDAVRVKGKRQPVVVFELLARAGDSAELRSFVAEFEEALRAYKERRWEEAYLLFLQFAHAHPDDQPTQIYLERCRQLMASPAPADWDGVFEMEHK